MPLVKFSLLAPIVLVWLAIPQLRAQVILRSHEGYIKIDNHSQSLVLGTGIIEERLQLSDGTYQLLSLVNRETHQEYVKPASPSDEFRLTVDGEAVTGSTSHWMWGGAEAKLLAQGVLEATVELRGTNLEVTKNYYVFPGTGIISQKVTFTNIATRALTISDPFMLEERAPAVFAVEPPGALYYMTGGGNFTGSQILKHVKLVSGFSRTFDSSDPADVVPVGGMEYDQSSPFGSGRYMPWFCISSDHPKRGILIGFTYYGHWAAQIGGSDGSLSVRLMDYSRSLPPGASIAMPQAFTGVYTGDLDSMGNMLKDWQYRYLWNHASSRYFAKIRYAAEMRVHPGRGSAWGGGTEDNWDYRMEEMFHTIDLMRYTGADILWQDAGWEDRLGDNHGPDFRAINQYLAKSGMGLAIWWPLQYAELGSKVLREHPDWGGGYVFGQPMNAANPAVIQWMSSQLNGAVRKWGNFQWRQDGTVIAPIDGNQTPMLKQFHNIMRLQRNFLASHPGSSIDLCAAGGNLLSFGGLELADMGALTDAGAMRYGDYYSSYLFPPDKLCNGIGSTTWASVATQLTLVPAFVGDRGGYGHEPGLLLDGGKEDLRKTFEIYHYLVQEGVAGRWAQIYHPRVTGDSPIYYMERLNRDGDRGVIVLKHFIQGEITIYPKGLHLSKVYDVRFRFSKRVYERTGRDLGLHGITLINPRPGELIYLGLPNHPGSGTDTTPPTAPSSVTKRRGTNVGVTGVELRWSPATDNNWIAYYEIYRDGKALTKVSKGQFYFDHSFGASLRDDYAVQTVDGDGNTSAEVKAVLAKGGPRIYTALGGYLAGKDYSYQGAHGWFYEGWAGSERLPLTWNGAFGQMGLYWAGDKAADLRIGGSWMSPGQGMDAVRGFTLPFSGRVNISGNIHKDIGHTGGNGQDSNYSWHKADLALHGLGADTCQRHPGEAG